MGYDPRDPIDAMNSLPHAYPFILLDRVAELSASRGVAVKNVSGNSFFSYGRMEESLFLPDMLLIEAMAELSGLVMNFGLTDRRAALLAAISTMRFERRVTAGESITVTSVLEGSFGRVASFIVEASVGSVRIAAGRLTLACAEAEVPSGQVVSGIQIR
ncbi:MAG: hypothetical protein AABY51_03770 [Deltaproteobacteria bacterium]